MDAAKRDEIIKHLHELCDGLGRIQIMEICGTHTVSLFRTGLRSLFPENLRLVSGPGCPVCVTAQRHIDAAIDLAKRDGVIVATYGDMIRVPGKSGSLERLRAEGADVRVINSAKTCLRLANENPDREVVFLAVGFETTAPATAAVVLEAEANGVANFSALMCHKLVIPAMQALLQAGDVPLDGFLCPGHVSVIIGANAYKPIVEQFKKPCVVAGFEPPSILHGIELVVEHVAAKRAALSNAYRNVVSNEGNGIALDLLKQVFVSADTHWRELGVIPKSGLELASCYEQFDAAKRFEVVFGDDEDNPLCRCGEVIQGKVEPADCDLFGYECTPLYPIGPCMVSSEGTCSAWYKYNRDGGSHRSSVPLETNS